MSQTLSDRNTLWSGCPNIRCDREANAPRPTDKKKPRIAPLAASNAGETIRAIPITTASVATIIAPENSVNYYNKVADTLGGVSKIENSYRLFMVPGMSHCRGGEGTDTFDMLAALERWVEQGKAPDAIPASRVVDGKTVRTRPLCPYPQEAVYKGSGSTDDAANFACRVR